MTDPVPEDSVFAEATSEDQVFDEVCELLDALDGVDQDPRWHPEGDALFHSLQVHALALQHSADPELWAAALLHDVGKGHPGDHAETGARLLDGIVPQRVVWLVRHHLDLTRHPRRTRRRLANTAQLRDLERLRRWDVGGRDPDAWVGTVEHAVATIQEVLLDAP